MFAIGFAFHFHAIRQHSNRPIHRARGYELLAAAVEYPAPLRVLEMPHGNAESVPLLVLKKHNSY